MEIIKPSVECLYITLDPLTRIEEAARVSRASEMSKHPANQKAFIRGLIEKGHHVPLEVADMTYAITCDRGVSHELVRHRHFSIVQESTRYIRLKPLKVIKPLLTSPILDAEWDKAVESAERYYHSLLMAGVRPEIARSVLPHCTATRLVVKGNFREWRHFFSLRTDESAHPQMREIAWMILMDASKRVAVVFDEYW